MKNRKRLVLPVAVALVAVIAVSGVAYAWWSSSGSGNGSAQAGTPATVAVNQTNTITGLYPGGTAQALVGNFDNPNAYSVHITSVTAVVASVTVISGTCATTNFVVGGTSNTPITIPAGPALGVGSWSGLTIQLADTGINQDGCKGATVNLTYTANP